jgi:hypothetical protein
MKRIVLTILPCLLLLAGLTGLFFHFANAHAASASSMKRCTGTWNIVNIPSPGPYSAQLDAVTAITADNVWTDGSYVDSNGNTDPLVEQWNGATWNIIATPNLDSIESMFTGMTQVPGTNQLWAVGLYLNPNDSNTTQTLTEFWNGTTWSVVPSPNNGTLMNEFEAVSAIAANDVWAVGNYTDPQTENSETLLEHWNGSNWSIVPGSNPGQDNFLYAVTAGASNSVWAVGRYIGAGPGDQTLIEHWNGKQWSQVSSPSPGSNYNILYSVSTVPGNSHLWAVGEAVSPSQTLTLEKKQGTWEVIPDPSAGTEGEWLDGVMATSPTNAWTVGGYSPDGVVDQTLTEHWNGKAWKIIPSPNIPSFDNFLLAVSQVPGSNKTWAVGTYFSDGGGNGSALVEYYC